MKNYDLDDDEKYIDNDNSDHDDDNLDDLDSDDKNIVNLDHDNYNLDNNFGMMSIELVNKEGYTTSVLRANGTI